MLFTCGEFVSPINILLPSCPIMSVITVFRAMFPVSTSNVPEPEGHDWHDQDDPVTGKKRPPAVLTLPCGVCGAPAPDHKHFGGREYTKVKH